MRKRGALEASRAFQQCDPESAIVLPGSPFTHQSNPEGYYGDKIRYVYKKLATINAQEMFILFFFFFLTVFFKFVFYIKVSFLAYKMRIMAHTMVLTSKV